MAKQYRLIDAEGQEFLSDAPATLGGNRDGKYGRFDCPAALRAIREYGDAYRVKRVFFADEATAVAAGYRPCGTCMRTAFKAWKAQAHA
ncbi:metal-binding protein [Methylobacterium trifolii]|uniref:Metal-binding protein n=1 Tax=Methylobacterium trifolii TaxID=1003092 RepID=A0ABQ4TZV8_9HYPH|nr:metal-binding protein [Methylobacterium trifolii]GJE60429.1 hypothetical protein MPOCJGCO_2541 [Methylobacterium trifolii]